MTEHEELLVDAVHELTKEESEKVQFSFYDTWMGTPGYDIDELIACGAKHGFEWTRDIITAEMVRQRLMT